MSRLASILLLLANLTLFPVSYSNAASCATIKLGVETIGRQVDFSNEKGALQVVNAYKLVFENPKCFSKKELREMKLAARDLIKECRNPKSPLSAIFGKKLWSTFCKGFVSLELYTK